MHNFIIARKNRKEIIELLEKLTDHPFGEPPNIDTVYQRLDILTLAITVYIAMGSFLMPLKEVVFANRCEIHNKNEGRKLLCGFLTPLYYPYNIKDGPLWYLHVIIEFLCLMYFLLGGVVISFSLITSIELAITKIEHLNLMIEDCINSLPRQRMKRQLGICVKYHVYIIEYVRKLFWLP